jgi:hypothetical protein
VPSNSLSPETTGCCQGLQCEPTGLSGSPAPGTSINAPRIENKRGFYGDRNATITGGLIHSNQRRKTGNLTTAGGANDLVLLNQEIHVILCRALAGQASQSSLQQMQQIFTALPAGTLIYPNRADLRHKNFNYWDPSFAKSLKLNSQFCQWLDGFVTNL